MSGNLGNPDTHRPYRMLSLVDVIRLVVDDADSAALREFHEYRRIFNHQGTDLMLFGEYLTAIRNEHLNSRKTVSSTSIIDDAYDLTLQKFLNLPESQSESAPSEQVISATDCRHYFRAFLRKLAERNQPDLPRNQPHHATIQLLQGLVKKQFKISLLEARRRSPSRARRYNWETTGSMIQVWLPKHLSGKECRAWLEEHIPNPDPSRPSEKERIQAIVDSWFGDQRIVQLSAIQDHAQRVRSPSRSTDDARDSRLSPVTLAQAVADEKASHPTQVRPSIRKLGPDKIRKMILEVFENLVDGQRTDQQIADRFGISKATFSRFAGRSWSNRPPPEGPLLEIPDLFRNTAQVLASTPAFAEIAKDTSAWSVIGEVARGS